MEPAPKAAGPAAVVSRAERDERVAGLGDLVEIGRGGFGVVYRAIERDLERPVAVKVLFGRLDAASRRRFDRERRALGKVSGHPHVVTVHRAGLTDDGHPFIVMELMERGSMRDRLAREGPVPWAEAVRIGIDVASALELAHAVGICHRDVKPGNLLVSAHGVVKLADFGMALINDSAETQSTVVAASLAHAAPEVIAGERPDERSDIYSLGSTLHELMRGSAPFTRNGEESLIPMLARIAQESPPSLIDVGVPRAVCDLVARAMAKDPADRPASAAQLRRDLARAQTASQPVAAHRTAVFGPEALAPPLPELPRVAMPTHREAPAQPAEARGPQRVETGLPSEELTPTPRPQRARGRRFALSVVGLLAAIGVVMVGLVGVSLMTGEAVGLAHTGDASGAGGASLLERVAATGLVASAGDGSDGPAGTRGLTDYDEYVSVSDDHGTVSVEVPAAWSEVNTSGYVVASEQIAGFFNGDASGAAVTFTTMAGAEPDRLLDEMVEAACDAVERVDYDDGKHVGRVDVWTRCGSDGTGSVIHVMAVPEDNSDILVAASVQLTQDRDYAAAQRFLRSIVVDGSAS